MLLNHEIPLETTSLALDHASTMTTKKHYCQEDAGVARLEIAQVLANSAKRPSPQSSLIDETLQLPSYA